MELIKPLELPTEKSLFAHYIAERLNKSIYETDMGFATYFYENDYVYIEDVYLLPEYRKSGIASHMVNQIGKLAAAKGIKKMLTSCSPAANGSTESIKTILNHGFKLLSSDLNAIYFIKELGE